jgi:glycine/D-amino acid oxidase-like deaminating enzyme
MGSSIALHLAGRGIAVTRFDREPAPFSGASRWNEGKIYLGYLYAADPTLRTARTVISRGLSFKEQVERLTEAPLPATAVTPADDLYLVRADSVVPPAATGAYLDAVAALVLEDPAAKGYLVDASSSKVTHLSRAHLEEVADSSVVVAGFRVPERSVNTMWVADAFVAALERNPMIELALGRTVRRLSCSNVNWTRRVVRQDRRRAPRAVRCRRQCALARPTSYRRLCRPSRRHRRAASIPGLSLFVETEESFHSPSAVLTVGPFGDVKHSGAVPLRPRPGDEAPDVEVLVGHPGRRRYTEGDRREAFPSARRSSETCLDALPQGGEQFAALDRRALVDEDLERVASDRP